MRRVLGGVGLLGALVAALWWLRAPAPTVPEPTAAPARVLAPPPQLPPQLPPPAEVVAAPPVPVLPYARASAQLKAHCARRDAACRDVPVWTPEDFDPTPRVRLTRQAGSARLEPTPGAKSPWARCVDATLTGAVVTDLEVPGEQLEILCPPTGAQREVSLWRDREPLRATVLRCLAPLSQKLPRELDATLSLVVIGEAVEVEGVELQADRELDEAVVQCLQDELKGLRVPFAPEHRPTEDSFSLTFKEQHLGEK